MARSAAAQVAAQHKRTVQDAVFPTSDADRKRVTRSVAAQVAAQSFMVEMEQVPLRPANVVTSYVIQGSQFDRQIIFETSPTEF